MRRALALGRRVGTGRHARPLASELHPLAWAVWLAGALVAVFLTSNPLYLATLGLAALVVYAAYRGREGRPLDYLLVAGLLLSTLTIPLNLLTGSTGPTELFALPSLMLPGWLGHLTLGGRVTAESLVAATGQALGIAAVLVVVCAFNSGVDHFRLLKSAPAGLAQLGVVVTVGLLIVPETLARASALREAQVVRGRSARRPGDLLALALPLLSNALERSIDRAESLDARGFGRNDPGAHPAAAIAGAAGLALAACGAFGWYYLDRPLVPLAALLGGAALVVAALWSSRGSPVTRLRAPSLSTADLVVMAPALAGAATFVLARSLGLGDVAYLAFPRVSAPGYGVLPALACLLFAAPALSLGGEPAPR